MLAYNHSLLVHILVTDMRSMESRISKESVLEDVLLELDEHKVMPSIYCSLIVDLMLKVSSSPFLQYDSTVYSFCMHTSELVVLLMFVLGKYLEETAWLLLLLLMPIWFIH